MSGRVIRMLPGELRLKGVEAEVEVAVEEAMARGWIPSQLIAYYLAKVYGFFEEALGFEGRFIRFRELLGEEKAHYSRVHWDLEVYTADFGWVEVVNNAWRSDYDLSRHQSASKQSLTVFEDGRRILPHMYEPSFGLDRIILHLLIHAYRQDGDRVWLKISPHLAPIQVGVFPLVSKDSLPEVARKIREELSRNLDAFYDEADSIGRRYRRMDEVGTPLCVTVDYQTLQDQTVTVRNRDDMTQIRVKTQDLPATISRIIGGEAVFESLRESG